MTETMAGKPGEPGSIRLRNGLAFAALFLLALAANLASSLRNGRLSGPARYDDVTYLADGLDRVLFTPGFGLAPILQSFLANPPHAPVSSLTAMSGFWLFGPSDFAAYLANGWVLGLYVVLLARLSRPLGSLVTRLLFTAVLVSLPVAQAMVHEFRPDPAAGLLFAIALTFICSTDFRTMSWRRHLGLAAVATLATITKPTAFILVFPGLAVAFVLTMVAQGLFSSRAPRQRLIANALVALLLYGLLLTPFLIVFGARTYAYVYQAMVTQSDVWGTPGSAWFHAGFYLFGDGGTQAMGWFRIAGLLLILADLGLYAWRPAYRRPGVLPFTMALVIIYSAMAISGEKTVYQGSLFFLPFILAAAGAFVRLSAEATRLSAATGRWATGALLGIALAVTAWSLPLSEGYAVHPVDRADAIVLLPDITKTIINLYRGPWNSQDCRALTPVVGAVETSPLIGLSLQMELARAGIRVRTSEPYMLRSRDEAIETVGKIDFVLMADPATPPVVKRYPTSQFLGDIFRSLEATPGVNKIEIDRFRGKPFWLFAHPQCKVEESKPGDKPA